MTTLPALLLAALVATPAPSPAPAPTPPPAATPAQAPAPTPTAAPAAADPWAAFRPLLGEWVAEPSGQPGAPTRADASFTLALDGQVLVRRNHVQFPPKAGEATGSVHDDLLVIAREGSGLRATYWDNEGHVIRYKVSGAAGAVTLESEPGPGPRFRLDYRPLPEGRYAVDFSIAAPPGGEFRLYQSGVMRRPPT
jgi:hypothetical protein